MATLRHLITQYEKGQLSYDQLADAMGSIVLKPKTRGKTLAEEYRIAEEPHDDNDPIWLDSALNRRELTPEQHRHLIDSAHGAGA